MKTRIFYLMAAATAATMAAQADNIDFTTPQGRHITVTPVSPTTVKVTNAPQGATLPDSRASVLDKAGYDGGHAAVQGSDRILTLDNAMTVTVRPDGTLSVKDARGNDILTDNGERTSGAKHSVKLNIAGTGSIYGTGERGHKLNLRGDTLTMYNRQNYGYTGSDPRINQMGITMPLFMTTDGYGIVFDDFGEATLALDNTVEYVTNSPHPVSYYLTVAPDGKLSSLARQLTELTGRQDLPPFWTLGYITSKYGYRTQAETEGVVDTLKTRGYPLDGIVLDLYWYGKEQDMGRLEWEPLQWPDHKDMLSYLKGRGVNLIAISQPYILRNGKALDNYNALKAAGMMVKDSVEENPQEVKIWVGEGGMFDVSNPDTRRWLTERYATLTDGGITGWWGDLGEPEVHPDAGRHANGLTARQYHNQYGNDWSEIIYNLFKERYPDARLATMMRGGTTGLQRYSVLPWSTDVSRSWGGLEPQITIMTQSGLSGMGYMGHDVGGFAVDPDNAYMPELYVRWLQLGTFSPMLRTHAQQYAEPYKYPQYEQDIILPLIRERYRWLPYNYSLAWENATKGYPLVRPLEFHAAHPTGKYDDIRDQYLWGSEVMVAPVLTEGAMERTVVFPGTATWWYDLNNPGVKYDGGTTATVAAPLEVLPLFARAGAVIPTAEYKMNNTRDYRTDRYTINYYIAPEGDITSYSLFEDDRTTSTAKGANKGLVITFTGVAGPKDVTLDINSAGAYEGMPAMKTLNLVIHGVQAAPRDVLVNGINTRYTYNESQQTVTVAFAYRTDTRTTVTLRKK